MAEVVAAMVGEWLKTGGQRGRRIVADAERAGYAAVAQAFFT